MENRTALQGTVALVAGASGGVGRAITADLLSAGADVVLVGRSLARLNAAVPSGVPGKAFCLAADLTDPAGLGKIGLEMSRHGRLDILILSAGIYERSSSTEVFRTQIAANVLGPYALVQAVLPPLRQSKGQVVFINSSQALRATAGVGQYAATMHGMKAVADSLRDEVNAEGVRVTSLYLGRTAGERQRKLFEYEGRPYQPEKLIQSADIARTVVYLLEMPRTAEVTDMMIRPMQKLP